MFQVVNKSIRENVLGEKDRNSGSEDRIIRSYIINNSSVVLFKKITIIKQKKIYKNEQNNVVYSECAQNTIIQCSLLL